ncbi:MAG: hypothetical protein QOJ29_4667 [Thermoleophilaceae bacterium]|nr:hypothetical protein [Thermoleophilaceae bacterium]
MISRRQLPPGVFDEAESFLWRGVGLETPLASQLTPALYEPWTFAPDFVTDDELARIGSSFPQWEARPEGTWEAILGYIEERIRTTGATWVVPDSLSRTTNPIFGRHEQSEYFVVGATPYYVAREPNQSVIKQAWQDAGSAAGALAILTLGEVPMTTGTHDDLQRLVATATDVAVEAYDHSGRMIFFSADPAAVAAA